MESESELYEQWGLESCLQDYWQWREVRERAAIAAMQGIISSNRYNGSTNQVAETAVRYADALVEELKKK